MPFDIHFLSDGRCDGESNRSPELGCSVQRFVQSSPSASVIIKENRNHWDAVACAGQDLEGSKAV